MNLISRRQALSLALGISVAATLPTAAFAADISSESKAFVEHLGRECIGTITNQGIPEAERRAKFRELLLAGFDVPAIGRFVLGRYWRLATDAQKQEFLKLFESMILKTYADRFRDYGGEQFNVVGSRSEGDDHAMVQSRIIRPAGGEPINIEWRVLKPKGTLKIVDVIVEGVSMSSTQQEDYASAIQRGGGDLEPFLVELRQRYGG
ncbi:ABC transporter substrate-binding protein [Lacibacterium aquatile]|uniref:ABC transporter substrate-binding protein n=1 Tax=Lacibacterium aquatile TaxID=1168082 RepID=A0ABW5DYK3_9PROT